MVAVCATGTLGEPLRLEFRDTEGHTAVVSTASPITSSQQRPMERQVLLKALGKTLGGGVLGLGELRTDGLDLQAGLFVSPSEIKVGCQRQQHVLC